MKNLMKKGTSLLLLLALLAVVLPTTGTVGISPCGDPELEFEEDLITNC